jgi:DNA (cytosine-5)-methyltransferase 1
MTDVERSRGTAGLTVASTFSGCGGSCLGFEMAGYRVLWANEFLAIARKSYAANHPDTLLDGRDIRRVEPSDILEACKLRPGELDVFNGSPPCQAFSSAGQGAAGWGTLRDYGNGVQQRNEDLFFEYVRLVKGIQPRAFVAENVSGLTRGAAIGMCKEIMRALEGAGYAVRCKILDAQWLGVPQTRSRSIFIGVRKDLGELPEYPAPLGYRYSLREALPHLSACGNRGQGGWYGRSPFHMRRIESDAPAPCITSSGSGDYEVIESKVIWDTKTSNASFRRSRNVTDEPCPAILTSGSHTFDVHSIPSHTRAAREWRQLRPGQKSTKYFNLLRTDANKPSPCILAGSEHGTASVTPPNEPRRFTIDERRVICSFPADFILEGTYAEQWARLGNAVPPLMMRAVAAKLRDGLFTRLGRTRPRFHDAVLDLR